MLLRMAGNLQKNSNRARPVVVARARHAVTVRATFFPAHDRPGPIFDFPPPLRTWGLIADQSQVCGAHDASARAPHLHQTYIFRNKPPLPKLIWTIGNRARGDTKLSAGRRFNPDDMLFYPRAKPCALRCFHCKLILAGVKG